MSISLGAAFALWFVVFRIGKFDAAAAGTGFAFRAIVFFGAAALWVILAAKILSRRPNDA
ncbi:MAG: hypothetical protein IPK58_24640 [Acidobacteria bacterium]|nr:hypothetical protein [Acidobacteriota bacterium]